MFAVWAILIFIAPGSASLAKAPDFYTPIDSSIPSTDEEAFALFFDVEKNLEGTSQQCDQQQNPPFSTMDGHFGLPGSTTSSFWSSTSCNELFSEHPPDWILNDVKNPSIQNRFRKNWVPLCSLSMMKEIRSYQKTAPLEALFDFVSSYNAHELDQCALWEKPKPAGTTKKGKGESSSSQSKSDSKKDIPVIPQQERTKLEGIAHEVLKSVTGICCPQGYTHQKECASELAKTSFKWCDPRVENCPLTTRQDTTTDMFLGGVLPWAKPRSVVKLNMGALSFLTHPAGFAQLMAHELGHACKSAHTYLELGQDLNKHGEWSRSGKMFLPNGDPGPGCPITDLTEKEYRSLFQGLGGNRELFECVLGVAKKAGYRSYEPKACKGCAAQYLFEAFGEYMWIMATPEKYRDEQFISEFCYGTRDSQHPLDQDLLPCFLKSGVIRNIFISSTGCRKKSE